MAPKLPEYYAIDESANFINTNAVTQTDILYIERDTGKFKLGNGERYCDVEYLTPDTDVHVDADILATISDIITKQFSTIKYEPPIDKKTAFNVDFGDTADTVARGKHTHNVSDIANLKLPRGVEYPDTPTGKRVLYDDGSFDVVHTNDSAVKGDKFPISSDWAATHERTGGHVKLSDLHSPVSISGSGISIEDQELHINFGRGPKDVCPGSHEHDGYARQTHEHTDVVQPDRLPRISRSYAGAVPPTGNPTGKCLHDDGSWKYAQSLTTVTINNFWIAPVSGKAIFAHLYSDEMMSAVLLLNSRTITRLDTSDARMHGFYEAKNDIEVHFEAGDIFQASTDNTHTGNIQIGILYTR